MIPYIEEHVRAGGSVFHVVRHMLGLFAGQRRGKWWRRFISERFTGGAGDLATLARSHRWDEWRAWPPEIRSFVIV